MKSTTPDLLALLASRQFYVADLWTITLSSGQVLRLTTADIPITAGGIVYASASHLLSRGKIVQKVGFEVDTLDVDIYPTSADLVNGLPFLQAVRMGFFDAAEIEVRRAFMPTYGDTSVGTIVIFAGRAGDIEAGRTTAHITVNSHLELLNAKVPRGVYQSACPFTLYDQRCGVVRASFEQATSVGSGATVSSIPVPGLGQADGWATHGVLTFTGGACAGLTRTINSHVSGVLKVYPPLPNAPAASDGVKIAPGCDKTWPTYTGYSMSTTVPIAAPYSISYPTASLDSGVTAHIPTTVPSGYFGKPPGGVGAVWVDTSYTQISDVPFDLVSSAPSSHQYSFSSGVYTFAAADAGSPITIKYIALSNSGCGKFGNTSRFGGQPFIPAASTTT